MGISVTYQHKVMERPCQYNEQEHFPCATEFYIIKELVMLVNFYTVRVLRWDVNNMLVHCTPISLIGCLILV